MSKVSSNLSKIVAEFQDRRAELISHFSLIRKTVSIELQCLEGYRMCYNPSRAGDKYYLFAVEQNNVICIEEVDLIAMLGIRRGRS
jgi:hypothetical protein